jgi:hypothetical protein
VLLIPVASAPDAMAKILWLLAAEAGGRLRFPLARLASVLKDAVLAVGIEERLEWDVEVLACAPGQAEVNPCPHIKP